MKNFRQNISNIETDPELSISRSNSRAELIGGASLGAVTASFGYIVERGAQALSENIGQPLIQSVIENSGDAYGATFMALGGLMVAAGVTQSKKQ